MTVYARHASRLGRTTTPFLPAPASQLPYWQCLKLDKVEINCSGYRRYTRRFGSRKDSYVVAIEVTSEGAQFDFIFHQLWDPNHSSADPRGPRGPA